MKILPREVEIVGDWIVVGGQVEGDPNCERIEELISKHLREIARTSGGWETLYLDPSDNRLWERSYPKGEMHGGGPPRLTCIPEDEARKKYGDDPLTG